MHNNMEFLQIDQYELFQDFQIIGAIIPEPLYLDKRLCEISTQIGIDNEGRDK